MSEWKPIETAPRDGTKISGCHYRDYWPTTVSWRTYHPNAKWKALFRDATGVKMEHLTHWMPLPEPPTQE